MTQKTTLPQPDELLERLAAQIRPAITKETALVGIHTGGVWVAEALHRMLGIETPLGTLDISFYRDDFETNGLHFEIKPSDIPFEVDDRDIILIDDVLFTGRTARAAINELFDYGRPMRIRLACLIDRGGRELPIEPQYCGHRVPLDQSQMLELLRDENRQLILKLQSALKP